MEEIKENYSEDLNVVYFSSVRVKSQFIYTSMIIAVLIVMASLPFIDIQISVQGTGIIQSIEEKYELRAPVSGQVNTKFLKNNKSYQKGDTLLIIDSSVPLKQSKLVNERLLELNKLKRDATVLINAIKSGVQTVPATVTPRYSTEWQQYRSLLQAEQAKHRQAEDLYKRYKALYQKTVISVSEFEKYAYDFENAELNINALESKYRNQWQIEYNQYELEERDQLNKQTDLQEQQKLYVVRAPVNGTLVNLNSTQTGDYVFSGQTLAELSPDTLLTAVCYVKPSDIGMIHQGQNARLQIDAFNYNEWGFSEARVTEISNDVIIAEGSQTPLFVVRCMMLKNYLSLKNGYQGNIKKGMTCAARFIVAKRSLFQLLYDKTDNWLNPNIKSA